MAQYFFGMTKSEKDSILNQHKHIYDGFVTQYGQSSNQQPLFVQDYANDKGGLTVSNKGVVKPYTNTNINESFNGRDMIADRSTDLKNGTVNMDDVDGKSFISLGRSLDEPYNDDCFDCDDDMDVFIDFEFDDDNFDEEEDEMFVASQDDIEDEVDSDVLPEVMEKINESLDMFRRFKNYN